MLNTVFANDVRQTLDHFRRSVDQLFDNFYGYNPQAAASNQTMTNERQWTFSPVFESGWSEAGLNLRAIVPGVAQNDLNVSIQNRNQLVIEGERKAPQGFEKNAFTQLAYGKFYTAVALPEGLDVEKLSCSLHDGILDIHVPVSERMKPRQIQIQTGEERKSISA
jgi:HSP20 family protein